MQLSHLLLAYSRQIYSSVELGLISSVCPVSHSVFVSGQVAGTLVHLLVRRTKTKSSCGCLSLYTFSVRIVWNPEVFFNTSAFISVALNIIWRDIEIIHRNNRVNC